VWREYVKAQDWEKSNFQHQATLAAAAVQTSISIEEAFALYERAKSRERSNFQHQATLVAAAILLYEKETRDPAVKKPLCVF
jgi:hypothetical protein